MTNTVTLQGIRDKIKGAAYTLLPNGRTTICQLTLENGFTVEGQSACVTAAIYNRALGEKYAYDDALSNCWKFEGYLLAERLYQASRPAPVPMPCPEAEALVKDLAEALQNVNAATEAAAQLHSRPSDPSYYITAKRLYQAYFDYAGHPALFGWDELHGPVQDAWIAVAKAA